MIDPIATSTGGRKVTAIISASEALLGVETGETVRRGFNYEFADYPFTKENMSFEEHLQVVQDLQPKIAVAPDIEGNQDMKDAVEKAEELKKHAKTVVIVPKDTHPKHVPSEFRAGYPNQANFGSLSDYGVKAFSEADSVHILGGTPMSAIEKSRALGNVESYDSTSFLKAGMQAGKIYQAGGWFKPPEGRFNDVYELVLHSLNNIATEFRSLNQIRQAKVNKYHT